MNRQSERYSSPRLSDEEMDAKIAWLNDHTKADQTDLDTGQSGLGEA